MYDSIALSRLQSQPVEIPIVRQVAVHPIDSEGESFDFTFFHYRCYLIVERILNF
jgi:hypothetical protein